MIFGVENSSSIKPENCKNNCLILGEGPTDYISIIILYYYILQDYSYNSDSNHIAKLKHHQVIC